MVEHSLTLLKPISAESCDTALLCAALTTPKPCPNPGLSPPSAGVHRLIQPVQITDGAQITLLQPKDKLMQHQISPQFIRPKYDQQCTTCRPASGYMQIQVRQLRNRSHPSQQTRPLTHRQYTASIFNQPLGRRRTTSLQQLSPAASHAVRSKPTPWDSKPLNLTHSTP